MPSFTSFYFESCIWPKQISPWIQLSNIRNRNTKESLCKSRKKCEGRRDSDYTSVRGKKREPYTESPNSPGPKKGETGEEQSVHNVLLHQEDCSQWIRPGRSNSQYRTLLRRFTATPWKYAKTSPRILLTEELAAASRQRTVSHFPFHQGISDQKHNDCRPPPTLIFCFPYWR
jgi:hypothetical protein